MKLKLHNDGKGGEQSFECWLEDEGGFCFLDPGYGATPKEAKRKMIENMRARMEQIGKMAAEAEACTEFERVNCQGETI